MSSSAKRSKLRHAARQDQFLEVIDRDTAMERFQQHLDLKPLGVETVRLLEALHRILASDIVAQVDVPGFDRSNVDGFALQSADTTGATEENPQTVKLNGEVLSPGIEPQHDVLSGTATTIATGAMVPRGADAVIMVEHTDVDDTSDVPTLIVRRAVAPAQHITFTGTDIAYGETILRSGQFLTSREIGVLAAVGLFEVAVYRRPRVAIISTGNEIIAPGEAMSPGAVFDSNDAIIAAAVEELGGHPVSLGVVPDEFKRLQAVIDEALEYDLIVLSGGTSKGAGDVSYRVVSRFDDPGIIVHGVALKPGKPVCLAVTNGKPVVILPGFPTSAIFTFHEFVAPVIRTYAGYSAEKKQSVMATLPLRVNSERGRTEYLLVGLTRTDSGLAAYPMGKGSGSVTTFSCADGFITIGQQTEIVEVGSTVSVQLLGQKLETADLFVMGSHCVGLDMLLGELQRRGLSIKVLHIGSTGGLAAVKRGECDIAGIHLMDPQTGMYNRPFLTPDLELLTGYRRMQGIVYRSSDIHFDGKSIQQVVEIALIDPMCTMVNRNFGSGTRILIDQLLDGKQPRGYAVQAKSHNAVATAIVQHRADWGMAIDTVAQQYGLGFIPFQEEHYDFVVLKKRLDCLALRKFRELLGKQQTQKRLQELGFRLQAKSAI